MIKREELRLLGAKSTKTLMVLNVFLIFFSGNVYCHQIYLEINTF